MKTEKATFCGGLCPEQEEGAPLPLTKAVWTEAHLKGREDLNCLLMSLKPSQLLRGDKENGGGTKVQEPELVS